MNIAEIIPLSIAGGALLLWACLGLYDAIKQHNKLKRGEQL